jgi:TolB protein
MKNFLCLTFVIAVAISLPTMVSQADDYELEVIGDLPLGKLAFVTSGSFGRTGTIVFVGQEANGFLGDRPEFIDGGKKIIYSNQRGRTSTLFVRNLSDNSTHEIETGMPDFDLDSPSLSQSGKKLAFVAWPKGRKSCHIYVADADGSRPRQLTEGEHHNWSPRWSPDGTKIVFESTRDDDRQIYVMDADGENQINLSNDKKMSHAPSWSPDGTHIAYMSGSENKTCSIYIMKCDGTEKQNVSHSLTRDSEPTWSPDSKWIAFTRTASKPPGPETMDIWIMRRDGLEQRQITRNAVKMSSYEPTWSR